MRRELRLKVLDSEGDMRSVPYVEKPFELRNDYLELPKIRDKPPFYTAFPCNKNFEDLDEQPMVPCGHV